MGSIYKKKWKNKDGVTVEGRIFWIQYYRNGRACRESSGSAKESDAKRLLKLREGDVARGVPITPKVGRIRFKELAEDVVNDYKINGKRSLPHLKVRLKLHILPYFGHLRAASIGTEQLRRYIVTRQDEGAEQGTINRELTVIRRCFSLGIQSGKLLAKPHMPMLKENNVRKGFFEPEQFQSLLNHLPKDLQPFMTFAYITGWRKGEIQGLQWRQVDFNARMVVLDPGTTKNGEGRVFPFTDELEALLKAQRASTHELKKQGTICPFVFHRSGKPIGEFRRSWKTACKKAGCPGKIFHDFRRTAVRNLVRAGVPERVAMQLTGHKTRAVFERYNIVSEGDLLTAVGRLETYLDGTDTISDTEAQI